MKRTFGALAALAVVALTVWGCGGSDTEELSKAEFIKQSDAICAKTDKTQKTGFKKYQEDNPEKQPTQAGQEKMLMAVGLPPIQAEAEELADLGAPSADADKIDAVITGIEEAVRKAEANPALLLKGPDPFADVEKLAAAYGFKECDQAI
jgi:hypothetical protein